MSFIAPAWLVLLALLPVVVALHARTRRRAIITPGLMLWKRVQAAAGRTAAAPRWPRPDLPMALQLLAVLLAVLALARPLWGPGRDTDHLIVVLDTSATMQTRSGIRSRFDEAQERIAALAARGSEATRVSLITTGVTARPVVARQPLRPEVVREALGMVEVTDGAADAAGLATLLAALRRDGETTRIVGVSHAPLPRDAADAAPGASVETIVVGGPAANAGLDARLVPVTPEKGLWRIEGVVDNASGPTATTIALRFTPEGQTLPQDLRPLQLTGTPSFSAGIELPGAGVLELALPEDAADFDNHVRFVVPDRPRSVQILHLGPDDQPLIDALQAMEGVAIHRATTLPDDLRPFDLAVIDNTTVPRRPEISALWIGAAGIGGDAIHPLPAGRPDDHDGSHPLTDGIDWNMLTFETAAALAPPQGAVTLLGAGGQPLLTAHTALSGPETGADVRLAFDPRHANWAGQPALALFAANLADWLGLRPGGPIAPSCVVGAECIVPRHFSGGTITRVDGNGDRQAPPLAASVFTPARAGLFRLDHAGRSTMLAINPARPAGNAAAAKEAPNAAAAAQIARMPVARMPVEITPILAGALLAVLLLETVLFRRRQGAAGRWPWLRLCAMAAVLFALADPPLPFPPHGEATAAILDPSAGSAAADLPPDAIPVVNSPVPEVDEARALPADDGFRGDTATALHLAAALLPRDGARRIALTPPPAHEADAIAPVVATLAREGIAFDILPRAAAVAAFSIRSVDAPSPAYAGDSLTLTTHIEAPAPAPATLSITRDGMPVARQTVALHAGINRVDIPVTAARAGEAFFGVGLSVPGDRQTEGHSDGAWISIRPPGRIAVISPQAARREAFARMLDGQGFDAVALAPRDAPADLDGWLAYDGFVLMNLPATALTIRRLALLEEAVRDHGRGLFLLGGPDSFGPGGYLETPLERLSPLSSRIPRDARDTAIVFVLDRSGSMLQTVGGKTRIDIAREAAMAAAGLIEARDRMGVVTFSADAQTVFALQPAADPAAVARALAGVRAGGGTAIHPGLAVAHDMLRGSPAAVRHVVVMTDGMSELADFQSLLADMRADGITVSTIAIGSTAETSIAEDIARLGGGAFHASGDFEALPAIMAQETLLSATSPVVEITTQPQRVATDEPFLAGLPANLPAIDGFVRTSAKPGTHLSWIVHDEDGEPAPWLASWRYGLGQVLAVAGDGMGPWSRTLAAADDYPRLWAQAMRQFLPAVDAPGLGLTARRAGDRIDVRIAQDTPSDAPPVLTMTDASGRRKALPLAWNGEDAGTAGAWRASFFPETAGDIALAAAAGNRETTLRLHVARPAGASASAETADIPAILRLAGGLPGEAHWRTIRARWLFLSLALALFMLALARRHITSLPRPFGSPPPRQPQRTRG